jgi:hypothetical protein
VVVKERCRWTKIGDGDGCEIAAFHCETDQKAPEDSGAIMTALGGWKIRWEQSSRRIRGIWVREFTDNLGFESGVVKARVFDLVFYL